MLEEADISHIDFISIDVEGHEFIVLGGIDLNRWKPRIVLLEDNKDLSDDTVSRHMASAWLLSLLPYRIKRLVCEVWRETDNATVAAYAGKAV